MQKSPSFRQRLTEGFCYGAELVTTRGLPPTDKPNKPVELAEALCGDARINWVSITDSPGGNTMLPPDWLGRRLLGRGAHVLVHLTCKDRNRNALESAAWSHAAEGFENIVAMTGDYPRAGFRGAARPVFDLDSVGLIFMLRMMNEGFPIENKDGKWIALSPTHFFIGCVVSPFKRLEQELMPQYFKLLQKISCGAEFVNTQLGYDLRKFHEVKLFLALHDIHLPVIGNVYLLNKTVVEMFHQGKFPGCVVSDELLELARKNSTGPDKGRKFFMELAAKQLASFKGLGFAGGYMGGISKPDTFFELIEMAEKFGNEDGREFAKEIQFGREDEFYFFERDPQTGLGDIHQINRKYLQSLKAPPSRHLGLGYSLTRYLHDKIFKPDTAGFKWMKALYSRWSNNPGFFFRLACAAERFSKVVGFNCRECGDCSLPDCGYVCPEAFCSKSSRNGPCGGSNNGRCELNDKDCLWVKAYERLKHYKESEIMLKHPPVFYNAALRGTSSWANTFLGRDHFADQNPVHPVQEKP